MKNKCYTKVKKKKKRKPQLWKQKTVGHLMNSQGNDPVGLCLSI